MQSTETASRTRRRLTVVGAAALVAVPALMLVGHGTALQSALAAAIADPASILAGRSPGARTPGAFTQTKLRYAKPSVRQHRNPTERVLGQVRTRPNGAVPWGGDVNPLIGMALDIPPGAFGEILGDGLGLGGPGVVGFAGAPATGVVGGPGSIGGGTPPIQPVFPPVSAIPEPSTWLMTILGFFAAGVGLRRQRTTAFQRMAG